MLSSIYLKTLRDLRGLILAWGLGLAAAGALNVIFFPAFQKLPELLTFLKSLPPVMKTFLGDIDAVFTLEGFLKMKLFDILPLLLSVIGISQASRALTGEVEDKTGDMLLALPITRRRVVLEKYLALATAVAIIAGTIAGGLIVACAAVGADVNTVYLVNATLNGLPPTWLFIALALFGSCALKTSRHAAMLAGGVVIGSYVFETVRLISPALAGWKPISIFAHHRVGVTLSGELSWMTAAAFVGLSILLTALAVRAFERRDL